jgi:hypothetical protein
LVEVTIPIINPTSTVSFQICPGTRLRGKMKLEFKFLNPPPCPKAPLPEALKRLWYPSILTKNTLIPINLIRSAGFQVKIRFGMVQK